MVNLYIPEWRFRLWSVTSCSSALIVVSQDTQRKDKRQPSVSCAEIRYSSTTEELESFLEQKELMKL